jgi:aminopeptidase N
VAEQFMQRLLARVTASLLALAAVAAFAQARFDFQQTPTILPKTAVPSRVSLRLDLDPARDGFGGEVAIEVDVRQPVHAIVLHARELEPLRLTLRSGAGARALRLAASTIPDTWNLQPEDGGDIAPGPHRLELSYRGKVQRSGQGLFAVEHLANGAPAHMLATQLEPVNARRVLPCFDEPVFRTVFDVQVKAPAGYRVLSNTKELAQASEGGRVWHRFAPTPPMQSYLLSVAVGRFDVLEDEVDGIALRIFTAPGKREQAAFAMASTKQLLHWYGDYFGRPFALGKLDQLAVPGVRDGAMEDWGMISYEENLLLHDPRRSPPAHQQPVFGVIAHEIAHQWFGDLVSPASWSEIWLNEAFATWMQHKASAHFHPEWDTQLQSRERVERTMARDATPATRAIRSGPVTESTVFDGFDDVTYQKGGAVLSMIEQWIGPQAFRRGLASYMRERAFKPATAGDLWAHIGAAAQLPVTQVASTWTDQPGVPVLEIAPACVDGHTQVQLRRRRFTSLDALPEVAWQVPARIARGTSVRTALVGAGTSAVTFPGCEPLPVVGNAGAAGYYRVDPDPDSRARLVDALPSLAPVDRLALLGDSHALVVAGRRPLQDHLDLMAALPLVHGDGRAALYLAALEQWKQLEETFAGTPAAGALRDAELALWTPEVRRLGWEPAAGERSAVSRLRGALIERLARLGDDATLAAVGARCAAALEADAGAVPLSLRRAVLDACGMHASDAQFDAMHAALLATPSVEEQSLLIGALGTTSDRQRAQRLLDEAAGGRLPGTLGVQLVWALGATPGMGPLLYDHVVAHWPAFERMAGDQGSRWLLAAAMGWGPDDARAAALARDQARLVGPGGKAAADRAVASIRTRTLLRGREAGRLAAVLRGWAPREAAAH